MHILNMQTSLVLILVLLLSAQSIDSARILGIIPTPSISHQTPFRLIALELVKRGHHVTVMTTDPINKNIENYTEVDLSESYTISRTEYDMMSRRDDSPIDMIDTMVHFGAKISNSQLSSPQVKSFLKSRPTFDVVIMERLMYQAYYGLIHQLGSPLLIGFISFQPTAPVLDALGNSINPAYCPDMMVGYSDYMSFWERLYNTYVTYYFKYTWNFKIIPSQEAIMRTLYGPDAPPIHETERNYSLLLVNNHFSVSYPRPSLPSVVELTGLHLEKERRPLPKDIQTFLDSAEHGVIYFSLGSNVKASSMPEEKRLAFLKAFAQLPQRVLWKWETGSMADLPPNVMVSKWLPQQDVLAHPKIRLFITQGGLQSLNEAAYFGVPIIGIPFIGEQKHNLAQIVQSGVGYLLQFKYVNTDTVLTAVQTILGDQSYSEKMKRLSAVYREHQETSLERAVWWIEYVVRHQGAPHLRSAALDLHWWQLLLLDVVAFVMLTAALAIYLTYKAVRFGAALLLTTKVKTH